MIKTGFLFFGPGKTPEQLTQEGLRHIRELYAEILHLERRVVEDVTVFFNYEERERRLNHDIKQMEHLPKHERLRRASELMHREHGLLSHETRMLEEIRRRLFEVQRRVQAQMQTLHRIEKHL